MAKAIIEAQTNATNSAKLGSGAAPSSTNSATGKAM